MEPNDLKFTTAGEYIKDQQSTVEFYINEAGYKIDSRTGELYKSTTQTQTHCSPP
jgi:hypothetical protein